MKNVSYRILERVYLNHRLRLIQNLLKFIFMRISSSERKWGYVLNDVNSVLHVGAQFGQERLMYDMHGLDVTWIEAFRDSYLKLSLNIKPYKNQRAIQALITQNDEESVLFNVASNEGASSSILQLHLHKAAWKEIVFERQVNMKSVSLPTLLESVEIQTSKCLLVLDTQGSELMILKGGKEIISKFKYILVECADFEAYKGGGTYDSISKFMNENNLKEVDFETFASIEGVGNYMNVLFAVQSEKVGS